VGHERKTWRVAALIDRAGQACYLLVKNQSPRVSVAVGIYEAHLRSARKPPNTRRNIITECAYLYTWAEARQIDLDARLLTGTGLNVPEIRGFLHWLLNVHQTKSGTALSAATVGNIAQSCFKLTMFAFEQFGAVQNRAEDRAATHALIRASQRAAWSGALPPQQEALMAPDLTDKEMDTIEAFLNPEMRVDVPAEIAVRDYLMWRLTSKLGLRIGEVLALRLQDCPDGPRTPLKIVRVESRGRSYVDPRTPYAPRPKTRSRDLNPWEDLLLPGLLATYQMAHRRRPVSSMRPSAEAWRVDHEFLILSHSSGAPLSVSGAQRIARQIAEHTGVAFHWHLGRHAYFNRAYASIAGQPNYPALRDVLQYKGGWRNPNSLFLYTRRIVHDQAMGYLDAHQTALNRHLEGL